MRPVQKSMVAHLALEPGGFRFWWNDGDGTRWSKAKHKTKEQAVAAIKKAGFGSYSHNGKKVSLS